MTIQLIRHPADWRALLEEHRSRRQRIGLVPTMGALHGGHLSLIRKAAADRDVVTVTDYVNPLQFAPTEDLAAYPRDLQRDMELADEAGAHILFAPTTDDLFPSTPPRTSIRIADLTDDLEGASRPGHFDGVATIVAKLFALAGPCWAYFGEKDFQQLAVIKQMVRDLSIPVEVVGCPTVREPDGLALSSRNAYLTPAQRDQAPQLYSALLAGKRAIEDDGVTDPEQAQKAMATSLAHAPDFQLDYAAVVDPDDLSTPPRITREVRLLIAARIGRARLIDNLDATPPSQGDNN